MRGRADFGLIVDAVPQGARVLDVGCADGRLLEMLRDERQAVVRGMELSQAGVNASVARGLPVVQGDADHDLTLFPDNAFDLVILSRTIQATRHPGRVLREMARVGRRAIVSMPNFAHWRVRLDLLLRGRMPMTRHLPAAWHETENLRLCSLFDLAELAEQSGWRVDSVTAVRGGKAGSPQARVSGLANLLAEEGVFLLDRREDARP